MKLIMYFVWKNIYTELSTSHLKQEGKVSLSGS